MTQKIYYEQKSGKNHFTISNHFQKLPNFTPANHFPLNSHNFRIKNLSNNIQEASKLTLQIHNEQKTVERTTPPSPNAFNNFPNSIHNTTQHLPITSPQFPHFLHTNSKQPPSIHGLRDFRKFRDNQLVGETQSSIPSKLAVELILGKAPVSHLGEMRRRRRRRRRWSSPENGGVDSRFLIGVNGV